MKKDLKDYLRIIVKNFYIVIILMIITSLTTIYFISRQEFKYESESIILIDYEGEYNYEKLKTYVEYLTTTNILQTLKENTKTDLSIDELKNNISVKVVKDTNLIKINIKGKDSDSSLELSKSLINIFEEKIILIYPDLKIYEVQTPTLNDIKTIELSSALYISLIASFIFGCLLVAKFGTDFVNVKNHEDLKKYLDLKSLGIIPSDVQNDKNKKNTKYNINIINNSSSITSEAYRMVRTNLDFLDTKVVNFTSTSVGEGKSETIGNIALSFSMIGKKVLLIDCDLRKPKIHKNFGLNRALGLTDILIYNRIDNYKNIVQEFKIPNKDYKIDIITAGSKVSNPSEILSSNRFKEFIEKLKNDYDLILIDCPPVSLMTDAVVISKISSGTAYVIEYDRFNYSAINKCLEQLKDVNANVLGGIITKMNINKQKKLYGDQYEQYYSNYIS